MSTLIRAIFMLLCLAYNANSAVLFQSWADGACGANVSTDEWDYTESGEGTDARMSYQCDTPVPGYSAYYRVTTTNLQHDAWNVRYVDQINLTPGNTYYTGCFVRFDRIGGTDIWHENTDSYDKLWETRGNMRVIVAVGVPDWAPGDLDDHKFTFGLYLFEPFCSGCMYEQAPPNQSPYSSSNPYVADYEKWYAVVIGFTPSHGSTANGRVRLWINGTLTSDYNNIKTQDSSSPYTDLFTHSPTIAQPAYDGPAHYRKFDGFVYATTIEDMQAAGLMSDPETTSETTRTSTGV